MENVKLKVLKALPENYHLQMFSFALTTLITNYLIIHFELYSLACTVSNPHTYISRGGWGDNLKFLQSTTSVLEKLQNSCLKPAHSSAILLSRQGMGNKMTTHPGDKEPF